MNKKNTEKSKCNMDHLQFIFLTESMEPEERGNFFDSLTEEEKDEIVMSGAEFERMQQDLSCTTTRYPKGARK
jgi:hypothetical protein